VGYVGSKGTHGFAGNGPAYDANPIPLGAGTAIVTAAGVAPSFIPLVPQDQRRPFFGRFTYPNFIDPATGLPIVCCNNGVVMGNYFGNDASSNYNALQIKVDKRFAHGLQLMSYYTWSHANNFSADNAVGVSNFLYGVAPRSSYGPDDMNRNHVWVLNAVYELPFGKGKQFASNANRVLDAFIGGWQVNSTTNWSGGLPFTPSVGECSFIHDTGPCIPDKHGSFQLGVGPLQHPASGNPFRQYFTPVSGLAYDPASLTVGTDTCSLPRPTSGPFSLPACGSNGQVGRNSLRGPRHFGDDMSIAKNFTVTERVKMQFRMDAFNVFNHPILGFSSQDFAATGGGCVDCSGNNGQIRDIENGTTMRELQFGLKLTF